MVTAVILMAVVAADDGRVALGAAQDLRARGRVDEAVDRLMTFVQAAPADDFADDCLAEAARWLRDDLFEPARSLAAWERLVADYPRSRHVRRARGAARELRDLIARGDGAESLARAVLKARRDPALSGEARTNALRELLGADAVAQPSPPATGGRVVDWIVAALVASLGLGLLIRGRVWRGFRQVAWPPPVEVRFISPVYALLGVAAASQPAAGRLLSMLALVAGGTLAWLWIAPAAARRGGRWVRWIGPTGAAVYVAGLCYLAVRWQGLDAEVIETLRGGPER